MSVETNELRRSTLQRKDRDELVAIAKALGAAPSSRARKAEIVELILDAASDDDSGGDESPDDVSDDAASDQADADADADGDDADDPDGDADGADGDDADGETKPASGRSAPSGTRAKSRNKGGAKKQGGDEGGSSTTDNGDGDEAEGSSGDDGKGDDDAGNRRRRRRGRDRERNDDQYSGDPVPVAGHLDLRDEGYGFLRTSGFRPSKDDAYVSVRQVRQFGLRRGDLLAGGCRPAARNEKNPALVHIESVNGADPAAAAGRPNFDELGVTHPHERLTLETPDDPANIAARLVDLAAPPGKGQRGLIEIGPRTGRTAFLKDLARAIEANHPDASLVVTLLDERPEDLSEYRDALERAEVQASTFDRPADDHIQLAELTIERAKRLAESGADVVVLADGLTQLARAYNMAGPSAGRSVSGIDSGAIYMTKRFFGAARKLEGAGSLTILATVQVDNGSRLDEVVHEELRATANWVLRLDSTLAAHRVAPAIDMTQSATSREELLVDDEELGRLDSLRRLVSDAVSDDDVSVTAAVMERLVGEIADHPTNAALLDGVVSGSVKLS